MRAADTPIVDGSTRRSRPRHRTVAGVTVHNITHTEAAYVLDRDGNERALFLYPFTATDVSSEVRRIAGPE